MGSHVHMTMLEELKRTVWAKTSPVTAGQLNAWEFRKDCLGNLVRWADFGNRQSPFGWEIDSIGGMRDPSNLQALHWRAIAARGDAVPAGLRSATSAVAA